MVLFAHVTDQSLHVSNFNFLTYSVIRRQSCISFLIFTQINPLVPSAQKSVRIAEISILKLEGIIKKISDERRDYESVEEESLS